MKLLHISDIHFRHPACATPSMDPDRPYRTRLMQDARARVADIGPIDGILVGGDIAFRGAPEEYEAAFAWLSDLADACCCSVARIFVVPGNHDVDRSVICRNAIVRNAQQAVMWAEAPRREQELFEQFRDGDAGRALLAPLGAYNDFAARFSCQVFSPERLFWHHDLTLKEGVALRIHGLTSTLLSGAGAPNGQDDTRESLYLSPLQTVLDPADGVVNLVMCHHPPDWFMDRDEVEDAIRGRAAIHLFGHKHRQRIHRDDGYVRFSAGAVNPDRNEAGWEPGYNLIRLSVTEGLGVQHLDVEARLLVWQTNPDMFRPKLASETDDVFRHRVRIRGAPAPVSSRPAGGLGAKVAPLTPMPADYQEAAMGDERTRNLVFRFWKLSSSERRDITQRLGLLDEADMALPEPERYGRALLRAGERGLLDRVADEIEGMEKR